MSRQDYFKREDSYKRAKLVRRDWAESKFNTLTALAEHYAISVTFAQNLVLNKRCVRRKPPAGDRKKIELYGSIYFVYSDGRIWSKAANRFLKRNKNKDGYFTFNIKEENGSIHKTKVHRLVLTLFDRPPKKGEVGRHLNDIKSDNRIQNLAWGTPQDNADDMMRNDTVARGEDVFTAKLTEKLVRKLMKGYKDTQFADVYAAEFIAKHGLDVQTKTVLAVLRGRYWTHVTGLSKRSLPMKQTVKLDEKAVHAIHKYYAKTKLNQVDFCRKFALYLKDKGYDVAFRTIKKVLNGGSWKHIYEQYN